MENQNCKRCNGTGIRVTEAFTFEGKEYPRKEKKCYACDGRGFFEPIDIKDIIEKIKGRKGLRTARPDRKHGARPYYVWRMARFHGGIDVTMPMCAMFDIEGDPFIADLDRLANEVAKRVCGTDMAAAYRWANALGGSVEVPANMPSTAFPCGPVVTAPKPIEESPELT